MLCNFWDDDIKFVIIIMMVIIIIINMNNIVHSQRRGKIFKKQSFAHGGTIYTLSPCCYAIASLIFM